jgi:uncharacterized membrane protein
VHVQPRNETRELNRGELIFGALVLVVAVALRVWVASGTHLWFDEIYTLWIARHPALDVLRLVAGDVHPPLHYLLMSAWRAVGGERDLWIKSLSIVLGVATVVLLFFMGRDLFGKRTGLLAAALLAVHPSHVAFSQEARSYVLLFLALTFAAWRAWRWFAWGRGRDGALYVLGAAVALYTHYLAGPVLAFLTVWGLVTARRDRRQAMRWVGLNFAVAVLFIPQLPTLAVQIQRMHVDHWVKAATPASLLNVVRLLSLGPSYLIVPMLALTLLPLTRRYERRSASLLWMTSLAPMLALWTFAMRGAGVFVERYMFFTLPAVCLLVAAGLAGIRPRMLRLAATAIVLVSAMRAVLLRTKQVEAANLTSAETWLAPRVAPGQVVLHADAHSLLFARHYQLDSGVHLLLLGRAPLPYYEGDLVVPAGWRVTSAFLDSLRAGGEPWWGVTYRSGYEGSAEAESAFARAARGPILTLERATVWTGLPAPADSSAPAR